MKHYIGIDLGTSNSAIASFDGKEVHVWKSPEQNDVTPSAIYVGRRGSRYYGRQAYEMAPMDEKNAATLFKRYMGTNTRFTLEKAGVSLTPEECSAEILRVLFSYLPEEIRNDPETATVITVPAAFNQVKKDATLEAANMAGIGRVALMQEPVAAVMSVMQHNRADGIFLIYDLGGGTFDVSVAQNIGGKVSLLAQGGREMCGGRDWDRMLYDKFVKPWLLKNFSLPKDFQNEASWKQLHRLTLYAVEQAKIELSQQDTACVRMDEQRLRCLDQNGEEIYLEVDITREDLNALINPMIMETVETVQEVLGKAGLSSFDVDRIVFVGGPSNYKPLRDKVAIELGVPVGSDVNPMTAVATGASIFAESIDWSSTHHNRKESTRQLEGAPEVSFRYEARTSADKARIAVLIGNADSVFVEIISLDTGWSSGKMEMKHNALLDAPLSMAGENRFEIKAYDAQGQLIALKEKEISVHRTMATISAIPASTSVAIKALDRLGGQPVPVYLVQENEPLPKKGEIILKAGETLKPGTHGALQFSLWEGNIVSPIEDNRYIGTYKIPADSFESGVIPTGADIICSYEMSDSGALHLGVSVPCVGADFGQRNFYSRQEGQVDLSDTEQIARDGRKLFERFEQMRFQFSDPRLSHARAMAIEAMYVEKHAADPEAVQQIYNNLLQARRLAAQIRRDHLREIRQQELDDAIHYFFESIRQHAQPHEIETFERMAKSAQVCIDQNGSDFDEILTQIRRRNFSILWKQDWYVVKRFNNLVQHPERFSDLAKFEALKKSGEELIRNDWLGQLRSVVGDLFNLMPDEPEDTNDMYDDVNVIRG